MAMTSRKYLDRKYFLDIVHTKKKFDSVVYEPFKVIFTAKILEKTRLQQFQQFFRCTANQDIAVDKPVFCHQYRAMKSELRLISTQELYNFANWYIV